MNEQIRLIAEESGIQLFLDRQFGWSVLAGTDRNLARFAELLVRECVSLANEEANHLEDEFELGRADDLRRWGRVMLQHFGVKE